MKTISVNKWALLKRDERVIATKFDQKKTKLYEWLVANYSEEMLRQFGSQPKQ